MPWKCLDQKCFIILDPVVFGKFFKKIINNNNNNKKEARSAFYIKQW